MILSGAVYLTLFKYQIRNNYKHTFTQTSMIFIGKYMNIFVFTLPKIFGFESLHHHLDDLKLSAVIEEKEPKFSKLMLGYSSLLETITNALQLFSLLILPLST